MSFFSVLYLICFVSQGLSLNPDLTMCNLVVVRVLVAPFMDTALPPGPWGQESECQVDEGPTQKATGARTRTCQWDCGVGLVCQQRGAIYTTLS